MANDASDVDLGAGLGEVDDRAEATRFERLQFLAQRRAT